MTGQFKRGQLRLIRHREHRENKINVEIVCLAEKITKKFIDKVLAEKPQKFSFLDVSFGDNDQLKTNAPFK